MSALEGKITKGVGGLYTVTDASGSSLTCKARGVFRKENITPCIGDNVLVSEDNIIEAVYPRKNILVRPPVANIDYLGIIVSAERPVADTLMLDKLTVSAYCMNIEPFVIINKCDIASANDIERIKKHLFGTNIECITADCVTESGIEAIKSSLKKGVTAFAGQSGVGKTSIISTLLPEAELEVGQLSKKLERGRHTTRHVELHNIGDGIFIMDTPGFSRYDSEAADLKQLADCFPEFAAFNKKCAFNSCTHIHEPECAVKEAVQNEIISKTRYENYIKIAEQIKSRKAVYK